jgi:dTDP-4-dehydrorhamnose reductase
MNILVTGAKGQLGSELKDLTEFVSDMKFFFHDVDSLDISNRSKLEHFFSETNIDVIVNCAAYTAVDTAEEEKEKAFNINHLAVKHLTEIAQTRKIQLIHISTDYVFDGQHFLPYTEEDHPNPVTVYGISKRKGEEEILKMKGMIIRTSWLYSSFGKNFVKTISKFSFERDTLKVIFDQVGSPTYARDLAQTILRIIQHYQKKQHLISGIFHFANEGICSWYDFAYEITKHQNSYCNILPIHTHEYPTKAKRPPYSVLDKTKIKKAFGISIRNWKAGLYDCLERIEI